MINRMNAVATSCRFRYQPHSFATLLLGCKAQAAYTPTPLLFQSMHPTAHFAK